MSGRLADRTVLITGSGSGIGAQIAERFTTEGARVAVVDRDEDAARAVAASLPGAIAIVADIGDRAGVQHAVAEAHARLGEIDVLVNNAATCSDTPFDTIPDAEWERDISVDLNAPYRLVQELLPDLTTRRGVVLNIASVNGIAHFGNEAYSAAKAGLLALTRSLAVGLGPRGIRVNAIAPGTIVTPIWNDRIERDPTVLDTAARWYPLGRLGTPQDVAAAALFLVSDEAAWITGTTLVVDGGLLAGNVVMAHEILAAD